MGFFSELKEDLSQAVNELIPEDEKAELAAEAAEEAQAAEDSEAVPVSAWAESPTQAETEKSGQPEKNAEQETVPADTEEKEDIAPEETLPDEAAEAAGAVDFVDGPAVILVGRAVAQGDWAKAAAATSQNFKVA